MSDETSLDDLFREAKAHILVERKAKALRVLKQEKDPDTSALYSNPENWNRTRGIALIHEETQTLLGNFSEYVHRSVAECRRLVREAIPITVSATESVSGSWWIAADASPEPRQDWHEKRPAIIHLHLTKLAVHSPCCEVEVHLSYGGIVRVELAVDTQFAQEDGKAAQLLFLPKGTNVLGEMSQDSKVALRVELAL